MEARRKYMAQRYNFSGAVTSEVTMTRGKPLPVGPVTRLCEGIAKLEGAGGARSRGDQAA